MVIEHLNNFNTAKTFNTGKKYAEEILFPKMDMFQKFQRQSNFGAENLNDSLMLGEELRDIQRFNGVKGMNDTLSDLLMNIKSTIYINKSKEQIDLLNNMSVYIEKLKLIFDNDKDRFFTSSYNNGKVVEVLNKQELYKVKKFIEKMYTNCEILMTKNKLLFAENNEEFKDDKEILEQIKNEYIDN